MTEFIQENASALFALAGAFGAAFVQFLASWVLKKREYDLRLWDKLLDRRISAHEELISVALEMRVMVGLGGVDKSGEVARAPQVLLSQEVFEEWFSQSVRQRLSGSTWLSTQAKREANFLQDYLVTLQLNLEEVPAKNYQVFGAIIRQDFIDISAALERASFAFFESDVRRLKLNNLKEWHKYSRNYTDKRLQNTQLLLRWSEVNELKGAGSLQ